MIARVATALLLSALWVVGVDWGYYHAVALHVKHIDALHTAVTRARDMQRVQDSEALRGCQTRVLMDDLHMGTDIMIAHSALKQAGMER